MNVSASGNYPSQNMTTWQGRNQARGTAEAGAGSAVRNDQADTVEISRRRDGAGASASLEATMNVETNTITTGEIRVGKLTMQGIGYKINPDFTLTPFISCLPADDPDSALPMFEKQIFGTNSDDPYGAIMKHLFGNLPAIQEKFFPKVG